MSSKADETSVREWASPADLLGLSPAPAMLALAHRSAFVLSSSQSFLV